MDKTQHIAVVCNYKIDTNRIGGMDRFYKSYDNQLTKMGIKVSWYFPGYKVIDFYSDMNLYLSKDRPVENFFLDHAEKNGPFDVVVTHFVSLCTPFFKTLKKGQNPFVIAVDHNPRPFYGFPLKKRIRNKIKGMYYSRYIDLFVGVSKYTVCHILKDYGRFLQKKSKVIYNGIDTSVYQGRRDKNFGKFIVVSHLRASKGIQDLVEAVNLLPTELRGQIRFDIYGEGPMEKFLKNKVKALHLQSVIHFKGSSPELPRIFRNYSYLIQPTYMECFSLSILESLAANVPVVTTTVGGNLEVITEGENGFIFPPGDIPGLAVILSDIVLSRKSITKNVSRKVEENFYLQKMVQEHLDLLPCI